MKAIQHGQSGKTRVVDQFVARDLGAPFRVVLHNSVEATFCARQINCTAIRFPIPTACSGRSFITRILHSQRLQGAELKFLREAVGLKQKKVAEKIEVTPEHLSKCENGPAALSASCEKLFRIFILKAAIQLDTVKECAGKSKLETALDQLFNSLRPIAVFDPTVVLEFHFERRKGRKSVVAKCKTERNDEGSWHEERRVA